MGPSSDGNYTLLDGIIRYKGRIWVGQNHLAQNHILQALHASGIGGHSGIHATYHRVKSLFAWSKLKQSVTQFVQSCQVYQQAKGEHVKLPGMLQPLAVPARAWTTVSLDFVEGLPKSEGYDVILVVIDKFTKYAHFLALAHPFTTLQVAKLYFNQIYRLHGLSQAIISDRDKVFTSTLWQDLFKLSDTQLLMSSSYYPQTDGQTERLNQCLEAYLRCTVHASPKQWHKWLPLAEYWYNTTFQSYLGHTPFEVLYGHPPRQLGIMNPLDTVVPDLAEWMKERSLMTTLIQQQLLRAQSRMKSQADKGRSERQFQEGEMVYLKLQPYVQTSVAARPCQKLAFRFYGPFKILKKIGTVAYKLELPTSAHIHPVIHVVASDFHSSDTDPVMIIQPTHVLARVYRPHAGASAMKLKIRWGDDPAALVTMEDEQDLRRRFPMAPAWGQAVFQEGGMS